MLKQVYGKWEIEKYLDSKKVICRCACGVVTTKELRYLVSGKTKQCATCHNREVAQGNVKHNMHKDPLYKVYWSMIARCHNVNDKNYLRYGARGIYVCDAWRDSFINFYQDMGARPEGMTLDRINNDGPYSKENCRWVSHKENCNNRFRKEKMIEMGTRFGKLTVVRYEKELPLLQYKVVCICGDEFIVRGCLLKKGKVSQCKLCGYKKATLSRARVQATKEEKKPKCACGVILKRTALECRGCYMKRIDTHHDRDKSGKFVRKLDGQLSLSEFKEA